MAERIQRIFNGLRGHARYLDKDGVVHELEFDVREDEEGALLAQVVGGDEYAMHYHESQAVYVPTEVLIDESPFEEANEDEPGINKKKIAVAGALGAVVAGSTFIGARYVLKQRRQ